MSMVRALYSLQDDTRTAEAFESFVSDLRGAVVTVLGLRDSRISVMPGRLDVRVQRLDPDCRGRRDVEIGLPADVFLSGITSPVLSVLVANTMEAGEIRLEEIELPDEVLQNAPGPALGVPGIRQLLRRQGGPLFAVALKPNLGMNIREKADLAEQLASCGVDIIKDDETSMLPPGVLIEAAAQVQARLDALASESFRPCYVPNVSGDLVANKHIEQLQAASLHGAMLCFLICGCTKVLQCRSCEHAAFFLYGHRAGYDALSPYVSMSVIAKLARLSGLDMVHVGTPLPGDIVKVNEVRRSVSALQGKLGELRPAMPVFSKTSIELGRYLLNAYGKDCTLMACGSIYGEGDMMRATKRWITGLKTR
jgi:ribulose-bisphosphate carboxylase large chain